MRVLCVNTAPYKTTWDIKALKKLKLFRSYKVASITPEGGYLLKGVKTKNEAGFAASRFMVLSKLDETTFARSLNRRTA